MPSAKLPPNPMTAIVGIQKLAYGVRYWAPVWIPSILLWQFATKGLQPALSEARRLERIGPEVDARHAEAKSAFDQVQAEAKAWQDPIYRERRRRLRFQDPSPEPLAQEFPEDALEAPLYEQGEIEPEWTYTDEPMYADSGQDDSGASPTEYLEAYDPSIQEPSTGEPYLGSQGSWGTVELGIRPSEATSLTLSSPAWTASEPSWVLPAAPETTLQSEEQNDPESSFLGD